MGKWTLRCVSWCIYSPIIGWFDEVLLLLLWNRMQNVALHHGNGLVPLWHRHATISQQTITIDVTGQGADVASRATANFIGRRDIAVVLSPLLLLLLLHVQHILLGKLILAADGRHFMQCVLSLRTLAIVMLTKCYNQSVLVRVIRWVDWAASRLSQLQRSNNNFLTCSWKTDLNT